MAEGWLRAGGCTDARTCGHLPAGWCTKIPSWTEKETPGAVNAGVAAARRASAQAKLSWTQHDAPSAGLACCSELYERWLHGDSPSLRASS